MISAPLADAPNRSTEAVRGCFLLDHPVPTPRLCPVVGEAQQVECSPTRGVRGSMWASSSRRTKVDQSGLFWVQAQAVLAESLRQHSQHPTRIFFLAKGQHTVVRVADQNCPALEPRLDVLLEPHVQHFVQKDVRQQG